MKKSEKPIEEPIELTNPILCDVIERNIRMLHRLKTRADAQRSTQDKVSDAITDFSGHLGFVYLHAAWFGIWILLNTGHLGVHPFDPFPYGLLTMIVSLEAIFLSTFVLISQNRMGDAADRRADLALQIGLLTESELTRVLIMLDAIQDKMGIENEGDAQLADLEKEVRPEDVLEEIERLKIRVRKRRKNQNQAAA